MKLTVTRKDTRIHNVMVIYTNYQHTKEEKRVKRRERERICSINIKRAVEIFFDVSHTHTYAHISWIFHIILLTLTSLSEIWLFSRKPFSFYLSVLYWIVSTNHVATTQCWDWVYNLLPLVFNIFFWKISAMNSLKHILFPLFSYCFLFCCCCCCCCRDASSTIFKCILIGAKIKLKRHRENEKRTRNGRQIGNEHIFWIFLCFINTCGQQSRSIPYNYNEFWF